MASSSPPPPPYTPGPEPSDSLFSLPGRDPDSGSGPYLHSHLYQDPRTSSTQSLAPSSSGDDFSSSSRRTLLVIYIHGFLGNDQSFRSFPAHVHALLKTMLAETHAIHTKIYPRYKTYRAIEIARDNFSEWLRPHESDKTDVVLVGHSMGGLLAADIALLPNHGPYSGSHPYRHHILGTVNLDCPFLGLHPGIIVSGISSLFKPSPQPPGETTTSEGVNDFSAEVLPDFTSTATPLHLTASQSHEESLSSYSSPNPSTTTISDPFFNPPFFNDNEFREQPFVKSLLRFAKKHRSENLVQAAANKILSYLEYGGCLADAGGLERRYLALRALEDVDELVDLPGKDPNGRPDIQVRFVNYYTLCPGRPKKEEEEACEKAEGASSDSALQPQAELDPTTAQHQPPATDDTTSPPPPKIQIERQATELPSQKSNPSLDGLSLQEVDPTPMSDSEEPLDQAHPTASSSEDAAAATQTHDIDIDIDLPPIPDPPSPPSPLSLSSSSTTDKDARKQAEKEHKRQQKAYEQLLKDRAKTIKEREKMVEKRRKRVQKEHERRAKEEAKQLAREEKEHQRRLKQQQAAVAEAQDLLNDQHDRRPDSSSSPKKLRQFCNLPRHNEVDGKRDPTWVDVFMDGVDEVGAHCGLFAPGQHYERLVGDVATRIVGWVEYDMTKRAITEMNHDVD